MVQTSSRGSGPAYLFPVPIIPTDEDFLLGVAAMIRFACHRCHAKVKAPKRKHGKWAECPSCRTILQVPEVVVDYRSGQPPVRLPDVELLPDLEGPELPERSRWFGMWLMTGCLIVALGILLYLLPAVLHPERRVVYNYLVQNLHDPDGMEIAKWFDAKPVWFQDGPAKKRGLFVAVAVRAKNGLGGRRVGEHLFLIFRNEVVRSAEVGRLYQSHGAPYQMDFDHALSQLVVEFE